MNGKERNCLNPRTVNKNGISIQKVRLLSYPGCDFPTEMDRLGQLVLKISFSSPAPWRIECTTSNEGRISSYLYGRKIPSSHRKKAYSASQFPLSCQHILLSNRGTFIPPAVSNSLSVQPAPIVSIRSAAGIE